MFLKQPLDARTMPENSRSRFSSRGQRSSMETTLTAAFATTHLLHSWPPNFVNTGPLLQTFTFATHVTSEHQLNLNCEWSPIRQRHAAPAAGHQGAEGSAECEAGARKSRGFWRRFAMSCSTRCRSNHSPWLLRRRGIGRAESLTRSVQPSGWYSWRAIDSRVLEAAA